MRRCFYFVILNCLLVCSVQARLTSCVASGLWSDAATWDNGIPICGDTIYIPILKIVTIDSHIELDEGSTIPCVYAVNLFISGVLHFNTGKKLFLSCGSHVQINLGGALTKGIGGGTSNIINICGVTVWSAAEGNKIGPSAIGPALPITLLHFKAKVIEEKVELFWTTLDEVNNDYFTIERSSNLKDVTPILKINGAGNSSSQLNYTAKDEVPLIGVSYYRLRQTDFNGDSEVFEWKAVEMTGSSNKIDSYYNKLENKICLNFYGMDESAINLSIYNSIGLNVFEKNILITAENQIFCSPNLNNIGSTLILRIIEGNNIVYSKAYSAQ